MEKDLIDYMKKVFTLKEVDLRTYSPLTLAYIGDGIFDLVIRTIVVNRGNCSAKNLHIKTSKIVKAEAQSAMIEKLKPLLTEEELSVYKRGRNAYSPTRAKNASMSDYRRATGFEALMGYLYLSDSYERMIDLIKEGLEGIGDEV